MNPRSLLSLFLVLGLPACQRAAARAVPPPAPVQVAAAEPTPAPAAASADPIAQKRDGERAVTPRLAATLDEEQPTARFAFLAAHGRCYRVVADGATALAVRDGGDKVLASADGAAVDVCAHHGGNLTVAVAGQGEVVARVLETEARVADAPKGAKVAPAAAPVERDPLALRIAEQARNAAPGTRRVTALFRGNAYMTDWTQHLDADRCYTFIGAGAPGVKNLGLYLWDPKGARVASQRSSNADAVVYHCTKVAGPYHFQGKLNGGKGDYAVGVFVKG